MGLNIRPTAAFEPLKAKEASSKVGRRPRSPNALFERDSQAHCALRTRQRGAAVAPATRAGTSGAAARIVVNARLAAEESGAWPCSPLPPHRSNSIRCPAPASHRSSLPPPGQTKPMQASSLTRYIRCIRSLCRPHVTYVTYVTPSAGQPFLGQDPRAEQAQGRAEEEGEERAAAKGNHPATGPVSKIVAAAVTSQWLCGRGRGCGRDVAVAAT